MRSRSQCKIVICATGIKVNMMLDKGLKQFNEIPVEMKNEKVKVYFDSKLKDFVKGQDKEVMKRLR